MHLCFLCCLTAHVCGSMEKRIELCPGGETKFLALMDSFFGYQPVSVAADFESSVLRRAMSLHDELVHLATATAYTTSLVSHSQLVSLMNGALLLCDHDRMEPQE